MLQHQSIGFQPINMAPPLAHVESARNLLFGLPKANQLSCQKLSRFDQQQSEYPSAITIKDKNLVLSLKK
jgi:hypothetical protein